MNINLLKWGLKDLLDDPSLISAKTYAVYISKVTR